MFSTLVSGTIWSFSYTLIISSTFVKLIFAYTSNKLRSDFPEYAILGAAQWKMVIADHLSLIAARKDSWNNISQEEQNKNKAKQKNKTQKTIDINNRQFYYALHFAKLFHNHFTDSIQHCCDVWRALFPLHRWEKRCSENLMPSLES